MEHHHSKEPIDVVTLAIATVQVLAAAFEYHGDFKEDEIKQLVRATIYYSIEDDENALTDRDHKDMGCRMGLLFAGLQLSISQATTKLQERWSFIKTIVEVSAKLLSGVPNFGFLFDAVEVLVTRGVDDHINKKLQEKQKLLLVIKLYYQSVIGASIFLKRKLRLKITTQMGENGDFLPLVPAREVQIELKDELFTPWFKKMLEWTGSEVY